MSRAKYVILLKFNDNKKVMPYLCRSGIFLQQVEALPAIARSSEATFAITSYRFACPNETDCHANLRRLSRNDDSH